MAKLFKLF